MFPSLMHLPGACMQILQLERCTFPPSALLELAPLSCLEHIILRHCDDSVGCPRGMAMLAELCFRLDAVKEACMYVQDMEEQRPGGFSWEGAASQAQEALGVRGKVVKLVVECWEDDWEWESD